MTYKEIQCDLFELDLNEYWFVQCISADFAMGKGIALKFYEVFDVKNGMTNMYDRDVVNALWNRYKGFCLIYGHTFNLITKEHYWDKPTIDTMRNALKDLKDWCIYLRQFLLFMKRTECKLAMPRIGCGLDKLKWEQVRDLIHEIFDDTDVDITVCYQEWNK